jgi:hypothetical protein
MIENRLKISLKLTIENGLDRKWTKIELAKIELTKIESSGRRRESGVYACVDDDQKLTKN